MQNRRYSDRFSSSGSAAAWPANLVWIWPFSLADLTAGLRSRLRDNSAAVETITPFGLKDSHPAIGIIRGIRLQYQASGAAGEIVLVVKEPRGTTRLGLAGAGRREAGVYTSLATEIPLHMPRCFAASPSGDWILLDELEMVRPQSQWTAQDFRRALRDLAKLHDRFWNLDVDLAAFSWLARPLNVDFEVHINAAARAVEHIVHYGKPDHLARDYQKMAVLAQLTTGADMVVAPLLKESKTMIHGDYWPGNIAVVPQQVNTVYDWQMAGIAPGILDLVTFIKKSEWWLTPLPLSMEEMQTYYRTAILEQSGHEWTSDTWNLLWDHALMWVFIQAWLDVIAASPDAVAEVSSADIDQVWLEPIMAAVKRRL